MSSSSMTNSTRVGSAISASPRLIDGGAPAPEVADQFPDAGQLSGLEESDGVQEQRRAQHEDPLAGERRRNRSPVDHRADRVDAEADRAQPEDAAPLVGDRV